VQQNTSGRDAHSLQLSVCLGVSVTPHPLRITPDRT